MVNNQNIPESGDFIRFKPEAKSETKLIFDFFEINQYYEINEVVNCAFKDYPKLDDCDAQTFDCCLVYLRLDPKHPCYNTPLCYKSKIMSLRKVSRDEHAIQELLVNQKETKNIVIFDSEKHEIITNNIQIDSLDDLIIDN